MEQQKFLDLVESNKKIVYKISNAYCRNTEDRKDLIQEIVTQLWKSYEKYDDQYKFSTWMYRISLNVAISFYRRAKKITDDVSIEEYQIDVIDDRKMDESNDSIRMLYGFIDQLDPLNKALIILYLEENSYKAISEILGITETNVATKIGRIKKKLQQNFAGGKV